MKKIFAILFALFVLPTFHSYAWIGGPFDNNSYTPEGDDGIYEAVAVPRAGSFNGIGMYRWAVQNRSRTINDFNNGLLGNTSNVQFGGLIGAANQKTFYIDGGIYFGTCYGTVNSAIGSIFVVGNASDASPVSGTLGQPGTVVAGVNPTDRFCTSFFTAQFNRGTYFHASRRFQGSGTVSTSLDPVATAPVITDYAILVFGNRVSIAVVG